ncbi:MAG: prenyltransferase/squalene oxidase repeat-containing protein [Candidatus Thorarchaeota archaeon]
MDDWRRHLRYDPIPLLSSASDEALRFQVSRDLFGETHDSFEHIWRMKQVTRMLRKQQDDGSWRYPNPKEDIRSVRGYNQVETFRILAILIEKYLLNREHPAIETAAEFLFGCQTEEGDFRGIYWNQYTPNYSAAFMELLIRAGYQNDNRIKLGLNWLLSIRQDDGGWAIPFRTANLRINESMVLQEPVQPNRAKRFSHMATGIVLRAFAAHDEYLIRSEVKRASELLASCIFRADAYSDRKAPEFWTRFSFPFWFTDLLSGLDSLSKIGLLIDVPGVREGVDWFIRHQKKHGLWDLKLVRGASDKSQNFWVNLIICRTLKRLLDNEQTL